MTISCVKTSDIYKKKTSKNSSSGSEANFCSNISSLFAHFNNISIFFWSLLIMETEETGKEYLALSCILYHWSNCLRNKQITHQLFLVACLLFEGIFLIACANLCVQRLHQHQQ